MSFLIKSGDAEFEFAENSRDSSILWSESPFMREGKEFGYLMLEPDKLSIVHGFEKGSSWTRPYSDFFRFANSFFDKLEEDTDLLMYDYYYSFSENLDASGKKIGLQGGGQSGFKVDGYIGSISASSKPFLPLTLSAIAPSGKGRVMQVIDMRVRNQYQTDDLGILKMHRRKGKFEIKDLISELLEFLTKHENESIEIVPTWQQK